jgi:hypothetical protein
LPAKEKAKAYADAKADEILPTVSLLIFCLLMLGEFGFLPNQTTRALARTCP